MSGATLEQKNGVLELTKLEYHKKWYIDIFFPNSVSGQNISIINGNGPFCPPFNCNFATVEVNIDVEAIVDVLANPNY